jgi:hypothetical protein
MHCTANRLRHPERRVSARQSGFAAYIIGGFMGLGILVLAMAMLNRRPAARPPLDQ